MTWEITRIDVPTGMGGADQAERLMAVACADGWELVAVVGQGSTHWLYFKRMKVESVTAVELIDRMIERNNDLYPEAAVVPKPAKKRGKADV